MIAYLEPPPLLRGGVEFLKFSKKGGVQNFTVKSEGLGLVKLGGGCAKKRRVKVKLILSSVIFFLECRVCIHLV